MVVIALHSLKFDLHRELPFAVFSARFRDTQCAENGDPPTDQRNPVDRCTLGDRHHHIDRMTGVQRFCHPHGGEQCGPEREGSRKQRVLFCLSPENGEENAHEKTF